MLPVGSTANIVGQGLSVLFADRKKLSLTSESEIWKILSESCLISLPFCDSQLFITVMDKLRLEIRAMDEVTFKLMDMLNLKQIGVPGLRVVFNVQIQPDLRELMETMNRMSNMPPDSEAKDKVSLWFVSSAGALHTEKDFYYSSKLFLNFNGIKANSRQTCNKIRIFYLRPQH